MKLNLFKITACFLVGSMIVTKMPFFSFTKKIEYQVENAEKPSVNPLKGWAPWIDEDEYEYPVSLVYVRMHWSEIEPEEGTYRFDELEKELHMDVWRERRVRFVIRIVCDTPDEEFHMDIPEWLYEKTYGDGTWYDGEYGKGYSPNYSNPIFIEEHRQLIAAFARYYGNDTYLGFVQLGSLGHWGEWHVNEDAGIPQFPKAAVYNKYIQAYLDVLPASKLMMRRPVNLAGEAGVGLFNDSFGKAGSHDRWLSWIEEGYVSDQSKEELSGMQDFWMTGASGGEFATDKEKEYYFSDGFERTMQYIRESHTTFLGPRSGADVTKKSLKDEILTMSSEMGYCFQLADVVLKKHWWNQNYYLKIDFNNIGVAPFYENWPLLLCIFAENGACVYEKKYDINLPSYLPGEHYLNLFLEEIELEEGNYSIAIGLVDPITGEPGVAFANENDSEADYLYKIMEFQIDK